MKTLKQKMLFGSLVVLTFGVIFLGSQEQRALSESEMATIRGAEKMCAQCLDMCSQVSPGNPGNCTGTGICSAGDWNPCHSLYRDRSTPDADINYCSSDWEAGEIDCYYREEDPNETCYSAKWCECKYSYPTYYCQVHEEGDWTAKDQCDHGS